MQSLSGRVVLSRVVIMPVDEILTCAGEGSSFGGEKLYFVTQTLVHTLVSPLANHAILCPLCSFSKLLFSHLYTEDINRNKTWLSSFSKPCML